MRCIGRMANSSEKMAVDIIKVNRAEGIIENALVLTKLLNEPPSAEKFGIFLADRFCTHSIESFKKDPETAELLLKTIHTMGKKFPSLRKSFLIYLRSRNHHLFNYISDRLGQIKKTEETMPGLERYGGAMIGGAGHVTQIRRGFFGLGILYMLGAALVPLNPTTGTGLADAVGSILPNMKDTLTSWVGLGDEAKVSDIHFSSSTKAMPASLAQTSQAERLNTLHENLAAVTNDITQENIGLQSQVSVLSGDDTSLGVVAQSLSAQFAREGTTRGALETAQSRYNAASRNLSTAVASRWSSKTAIDEKRAELASRNQVLEIAELEAAEVLDSERVGKVFAELGKAIETFEKNATSKVLTGRPPEPTYSAPPPAKNMRTLKQYKKDASNLAKTEAEARIARRNTQRNRSVKTNNLRARNTFNIETARETAEKAAEERWRAMQEPVVVQTNGRSTLQFGFEQVPLLTLEANGELSMFTSLAKIKDNIRDAKSAGKIAASKGKFDEDYGSKNAPNIEGNLPLLHYREKYGLADSGPIQKAVNSIIQLAYDKEFKSQISKNIEITNSVVLTAQKDEITATIVRLKTDLLAAPSMTNIVKPDGTSVTTDQKKAHIEEAIDTLIGLGRTVEAGKENQFAARLADQLRGLKGREFRREQAIRYARQSDKQPLTLLWEEKFSVGLVWCILLFADGITELALLGVAAAPSWLAAKAAAVEKQANANAAATRRKANAEALQGEAKARQINAETKAKAAAAEFALEQARKAAERAEKAAERAAVEADKATANNKAKKQADKEKADRKAEEARKELEEKMKEVTEAREKAAAAAAEIARQVAELQRAGGRFTRKLRNRRSAKYTRR